MSYMDRKNILTESQIDDILKLLRKSGKGKEADKIEKSKELQKDVLKLQKQVDVINKGKKKLEKLFNRKYIQQTIMDYL